jgi:hypothetical protein
LGLVEGNVGNVFLGGCEVDGGLGGCMVTPGAYGIEICNEFRRELGGEGFAVQLLREAGGEVLEENDADGDCVAGCPGSGLVTEEAELDREVCPLGFHGGVDAASVEFEPAHLVGWEDGDGAVNGGSDLEGALQTVVGDHAGAENFGHIAGDVAAKGVHLPKTVLGGDVALGDDEVVERGGADVGNALGVALNGDRSREAGDRKGAVELGKRVVHGLAGPMASGEEGDDREEDKKWDEDGDCFEEEGSATARGGVDELFVDGAVEESGWFGSFRFVVIHVLFQRINARE